MNISRRKILLTMARKCISLGELTKTAGICSTTFYSILNDGTNDTRQVRVENAGKIARALGVDVTEILAD